MSVIFLEPCPVDCAGALGYVDFSECAPEYHHGEISKMYVARADADDFTAVWDPDEWTARLHDDTDDPQDIRTLIGIGELPEPEMTEQPTSGDRTYVGPKTYNLLFEVDESNDINYALMLETQCNLRYKVWLEMSDGMLYGGNTGIELTLHGSHPLLKGREELQKIIFKGKWKSMFDPTRCLMPTA